MVGLQNQLLNMTRVIRADNNIVKEIESGKYRQHFLIYNRKSTDDTVSQKNSIKYQKSENTRFAYRAHLPVASLTVEGFATDGIVSERHSGFKEDIELTFGADSTVRYRVERPKFHRLVHWLSKGYFKGVIFLCWDRASRNKGDDTILRKLMKAGVDIRFTLAQYEKSSAGELHMDIDGMFSEHHSRVTREKVTITIRDARARGLWPNKAPVGYLNEGTMEHKRHDASRAPIILRLAELADTGLWSLADLARWAIKEGFTMPPLRRRRTKQERLAEEEEDIRVKIEPICRLPTFSTVHKILTNRFYTGKVQDENGHWIPSTCHEAIIPENLFNRVQERLARRNKSVHYAEVLAHPLRGVVRCGVCGRIYTPYPKKGIMYYGAHCQRSCPNPTKSFNFDFITTKIGDLIDTLSFTSSELEEIEARASTDIAHMETERLNLLENAERRKKKLREDLAYLNANRLSLLRTGAYTAEALAAEDARLSLELDGLWVAEQASDTSMGETVREVIRLSELLKNGAVYYRSANPPEKERITRVVFSELTLSENTLQYKCKNGFHALQSRFVSFSGPKGWLSELFYLRDQVVESTAELAALIKT